eukprot:CAMPEP_0195514520 /NCGR_PEP_ID=MMETSP0794_2-20130614/5878_1 /TAXON_ID=515487 /ORGANISM="Stephanopyxis turris, Strain CCMP 815" /LENGTH=348 /DNA_ID=CAMNT_0040642775 /DNA_START=233 /DNA_END=1279 /DNA_ORIENTATION=-
MTSRAAVFLFTACLLRKSSAQIPLPQCEEQLCDFWLNSYGGNYTELSEGEMFDLSFPVEAVTNIWQITACGNVPYFTETYGEFSMFIVNDKNLDLALNRKPFKNCSCQDLDGDPLTDEPASSVCLTSADAEGAPDVAWANELSCDANNGPSTDTCNNVLIRCDSKATSNTTAACRIGLSVQILMPDPMLEWWSFEYIPFLFGFVLLVVGVSFLAQHMRRRYLARRARLQAQRQGLLPNEVDVRNYGTGAVVQEGTLVDEDTIPSGSYVVGPPRADGSRPVATKVRTYGDDETIFNADVDAPIEAVVEKTVPPEPEQDIQDGLSESDHQGDNQRGGGGGGGGAANQEVV